MSLKLHCYMLRPRSALHLLGETCNISLITVAFHIRVFIIKTHTVFLMWIFLLFLAFLCTLPHAHVIYSHTYLQPYYVVPNFLILLHFLQTCNPDSVTSAWTLTHSETISEFGNRRAGKTKIPLEGF